MIKEFCDYCGKEITEKNNGNRYNDRITIQRNGRYGEMFIQIMTGLDGVWNQGIFCKYCIIDAIKELDDRK